MPPLVDVFNYSFGADFFSGLLHPEIMIESDGMTIKESRRSEMIGL
jgi:hypothetical protein